MAQGSETPKRESDEELEMQAITLPIEVEERLKKLKMGSLLRKRMIRELIEAKKYPKVMPLPEEVLEMVLHKIGKPKDMKSASEASPQFKRILEPIRPLWMFDEVFPLLIPHLTKFHVYNLRFVCKHWKQSIDEFLQTCPGNRRVSLYPSGSYGPSHYPLYYPLRYPTLEQQFFNPHSMVDQLVSFSRKLRHVTVNPFLLRSVKFRKSESCSYWHYVVCFLGVHGSHIWHVSLGPATRSVTFNYQIIRKALILMPNLKTLCLYSDCLPRSAVLADDDTPLIEFMQDNPLPYLAHIEVLASDASHCGGVPTPDQGHDEILRSYAPYAKRITWPVDSEGISIVDGVGFPEVQQLCLSVPPSHREWKIICRSVSAPNLIKLEIVLKSQLDFADVLEPIFFSFPGLVYLKIDLPIDNKGDVGSWPRVKFARVKTLEVSEKAELHYDQLLAYFPNLEYLMIYSKTNREVSFQDYGALQIREKMYTSSIHESNIWKAIPSLKEFIFTWEDFSHAHAQIKDLWKVQRYMRGAIKPLTNSMSDSGI